MPLILGGAAIAAPILGGVVGNLASQDDVDKAKQLQLQALQGIQGVGTPTLDQLQIALQKYGSPEGITPNLQGTVSQENSAMSGISTDPRLRQAQMNALAKLQSVGAGGLQPQDQAALASIKQNADAQAQAQQASILQNMQQRGIAGSGAELAAKLQSAQGAANRQASEGLNVQGQAAQRALQAIAQSGQLGSQIQGQDFNQAAQIAQAQDVINRFNSANKQQVMGQNVAAQNAAQYYNVGNRNQSNMANTQLTNQQAMQHAQAAQQAYQNAMEKQKAVYAGQQGMAGQDMANAQRTQQMWSGIGQGVGQGAAAGAGYAQNQQFLDAYKAANPSQKKPVNAVDMDVPNTDENYQQPKFGSSLGN